MRTHPRALPTALALIIAAVAATAAPAVAQRTAPRGPGRTAPGAGTHDLSADLSRWTSPVRYDSQTRSTMDATIIQKVDLDTEMDMRIVLQDADPAEGGGGTITLTHERMRVKVEGMLPNTGEYDSTKPDVNGDSVIGRVVASIVDKPITLTIDAEGKITSVAGLDALAPQGAEGTLFRSLFTEEAFIRMYGPLFAIKRDPNSAEVGEEWQEVSNDASSIGLMAHVHTLKFERMRGTLADVTITGKVNMEDNAGMFKQDSKVDGSAVWDSAASRLTKLETEYTLNAKSDDSANMMGMNVSIDIEGATRLTLVEGEPDRGTTPSAPPPRPDRAAR